MVLTSNTDVNITLGMKVPYCIKSKILNLGLLEWCSLVILLSFFLSFFLFSFFLSFFSVFLSFIFMPVLVFSVFLSFIFMPVLSEDQIFNDLSCYWDIGQVSKLILLVSIPWSIWSWYESFRWQTSIMWL